MAGSASSHLLSHWIPNHALTSTPRNDTHPKESPNMVSYKVFTPALLVVDFQEDFCPPVS